MLKAARFVLPALVAVLLTLAFASPSLAADPTDAAGVITATSGVFTAVPILLTAVIVAIVIGAAMFMSRRGAKVGVK